MRSRNFRAWKAVGVTVIVGAIGTVTFALLVFGPF